MCLRYNLVTLYGQGIFMAKSLKNNDHTKDILKGFIRGHYFK